MERCLRNTLQDGRFSGTTKARSRIMAAVKSSRNRSTERRFASALARWSVSGWTTKDFRHSRKTRHLLL